jgi:HAD superfamily hydrolase (TIGR01509 family)
MDGTLVTFQFDIKGTRRALMQELSDRGFETTGIDLTTPTQTILDSAWSQVASGNVKSDFAELRAHFYRILDAFEMESVASTSVFPGTREALERLKTSSVRLAVLTNSGRKAAFDTLRRANLIDCFEFILTRDETETMKPRPEGLKRAVALLRLAPESVYFVGDSPYDIFAAKAAGVKVISVATGNYTMERLKGEGAEQVVASVAEIPTLLGM